MHGTPDDLPGRGGALLCGPRVAAGMSVMFPVVQRTRYKVMMKNDVAKGVDEWVPRSPIRSSGRLYLTGAASVGLNPIRLGCFFGQRPECPKPWKGCDPSDVHQSLRNSAFEVLLDPACTCFAECNLQSDALPIPNMLEQEHTLSTDAVAQRAGFHQAALR
jgi:hypothetical protein